MDKSPQNLSSLKQQPANAIHRPLSAHSSHRFLAPSLETKNAPSNPTLGQSSSTDVAKESDRHHHQVLRNEDLSGRERLKRHRDAVAGQTLVPDKWSQESLLKEWMDYSSFDKLLAPIGLDLAREALMAEGRRRAKSQRLRLESSC